MITLDDTMTQTLPCRLTPEEVAAHADQAARLHAEIAQHEMRSAEVRSRLKEEHQQLTVDLAVAMERVRTKTEPREVRCREVLLADERLVETVREDTGEVISRRPARANELQTPIPFGPRKVQAESEGE